MKKWTVRVVFALLTVSYIAAHFMGPAHAQSSLGVGVNEATVPSGGAFAGLMAWINAHQQAFYRSLTGALKEMREDGGKLWILVGLSFAYGVFHAAGPGHGKAVISSYMLANEVALRRGIMLSFVSALLQAATAIVLMTLVFLVLRGTAVSMTDATWFLEVASYALITLFGAWLLWKKAGPTFTGLFGLNPVRSLSAAHAHAGAGHHGHDHGHHHHGKDGHGHSHHHDPGHAHHHARDPHHGHAHAHASAHSHHGHVHTSAHAHAHHAHGPGDVCESCGHSHAPDPSTLSGDRFDWRTAWSAVAAVGLRPCSGALIVLSFAFLHGLWIGGLASVVAMALGTAITVAVLATLAVTAKNWAVALAGDGRAGNRIHTAVEIGGAALVFLLGVSLLAASLSA